MSYQFGPDFQSVRTGKVSELIAEQIKHLILTGTMKPGDRLPSERELVRRFEASRNSVREAVKILEIRGLLAIKRGSGVYVTDINSKPMSDSLSSMLKVGKITVNQLTQARLVLEPGTARLACELIEGEDLRKLEENVKEASAMADSGRSAVSQNVRFHTLIAEATGNPVILLTMKTLFDVIEDTGVRITSGSPRPAEGSIRAVKHHKRILKAFRKREAQIAYDLMLEHILEIQEALRRLNKEEYR
jgi:GntR family transcriptional repressor for pyruvate dehydrogenase complex